MNKTYYILIFLGFISFGCEKNITLDIPKYDSKVVVYCVLSPGMSPVMSLSLSQSYYSYADTTLKPSYITNAQVVITDQNTNIKDTLKFDTASFSKFYYGKQTPIPGHHYIANISYQGKMITAETSVPMPVKIDSINYIKIDNAQYPGYSGAGYQFHIFFKDIPGETDEYLATQDSNADYSSFTSDAGLDGKQFELITDYGNSNGYTPPPPPFTVNFAVSNATKATADYLTNVYSQRNSAGDPFSQPVIVEGNINGGLGLFGAMAHSIYFTVKVK